MGQVFAFADALEKVRDWSFGERSELGRLARSVTDDNADLDVAFGRTDGGDPWCAVTDADGQLLAHVARIDGRIIVYAARDDVVAEYRDLRAALAGSVASEAASTASAEILPFEQRRPRDFAAAVVIAAFVAGVGVHAEADAATPDEAAAPTDLWALPLHLLKQLVEFALGGHAPEASTGAAVALVAEAPVLASVQPARGAAELVLQALAAPADDRSPPVPGTQAGAGGSLSTADAGVVTLAGPQQARLQQPADAPAALPADHILHGTAGNDVLVGKSGSNILLGGAGNDELRPGSSETAGRPDYVDGGPGDDWIHLAPGAVAVGGPGADTFQAGLAHGPHFGTILDFNLKEGDWIVGPDGRPAVFLDVEGSNDTLGVLASRFPGAALPAEASGHKQSLDFDGDGAADGYVVLVDHAHLGALANQLGTPSPQAVAPRPVDPVPEIPSVPLAMDILL